MRRRVYWMAGKVVRSGRRLILRVCRKGYQLLLELLAVFRRVRSPPPLT